MYPPRLIAGILCALALAPASRAQCFSFAHDGVLGTSLDLKVTAPDAELAERAETAILAEIRRLDGMLSAHRRDSDFMRFAESRRAARLPSELLEVLARCDHWGQATKGAFDPAFERQAQTPSTKAEEAPAATLEASVRPPEPAYASPWRLDPEAGTATMVDDVGVSIDALAKGYIVDRACAVGLACDPSVTGIVVNIGGDLFVAGEIAERVGVTDPRHPADNADPLCVLSIEGHAVATSGGYARSVAETPPAADHRAPKSSHILDPDTGKSVEGVISATVIAPTCVDADALATALNVMPCRQGMALVESLPAFEAVIVESDGKAHFSSGIQALRADGDPPAADVAPPGAVADTGLEVVLRFSMRGPTAKDRRSYRRPYVAAWIEDAEGDPVRTLCLWIEGRRWLRDLKTWYRLHRNDPELIDTVSRATRRPGEYELVWDGKSNDHADLPAQDYVLCLEIAREHGTHQLMRVPVALAGAQEISVAPNEEIARATVLVRAK
ncbi:MAG: DUF2271 domain-containing protein [Planctomycetota bacterium]